MTIDEFRKEFIQEIRSESLIKNDIPSNVFLETMSEHLQNMDYIFNPTIMQFNKQRTQGKTMKFDLYSYDEYDKSLVLLINDYDDDDESSYLVPSEINQMTSRMLNYLEETYNGTIFKFLDPSEDVYKLSNELNEKLTRDYINANNDDSIEKIKLFIITNRKLSKLVKNTKLDDFYGKRVELNVWGIERIFDVYNSGRDKEPIVIDFERLNGAGIPFLKADFGEVKDYDAYLTIIPGKLLAEIYWEHGSRLLEGNVRAFLSNKGKVNKGIRYTIINAPDRFFTYNNGIACTAKQIELSSNGDHILKIEDLQIINGGQTTASLTSAWKKDKANLDNIYVPMKLTIVKSELYDEMIQNISRFANSQNKVTDADLFSNHAFHREIEKLSRETPAPPKLGEVHNSYWYYERARGKYQQSKFKLNTDAKLREYERKYPKSQVITKEDLAKYLMAGIYMRPDWVSKGRAKNMTEFASLINKEWVKDKTVFNQVYFKNAVCYAILYKSTDHLVSNAPWYSKGGIKLNIVPYTVAKLISCLPEGYMIDLNRIWRDQSIYKSLEYELTIIAQHANDFINDSRGVIPTEFAKKEDTWERFKAISHTFSKEFMQDLVRIGTLTSQMNLAQKSVRESEKVALEIKIYELAQSENKMYWQRLLKEGNLRGLISVTENEIISNYICELVKPVPKRLPTQIHYKIAWDVRKRLEDNGVLV